MRGAPLLSLLAGLLALPLGVGATFMLLSLLVGKPIGPKSLFHVVTVHIPMPGPAETSEPNADILVVKGNDTRALKVIKTIPSIRLVGLLVAGACCGGLGIALAQSKGFARGARIAKWGLMSNVAGILVWWLTIMLTDWTRFD
jgi:hypothetical protein